MGERGSEELEPARMGVGCRPGCLGMVPLCILGMLGRVCVPRIAPGIATGSCIPSGRYAGHVILDPVRESVQFPGGCGVCHCSNEHLTFEVTTLQARRQTHAAKHTPPNARRHGLQRHLQHCGWTR